MNNAKSDVLIVGGGLSGYSCCYWINQLDPKAKVTIIQSGLEEHRPASLLNAGFLTVGSLNFYLQNKTKFGTDIANEILNFCKENHELLHQQGLLKNCPSYVQNGSLSISSTRPADIPPGFKAVSPSSMSLRKDESSWRYDFDGSVHPDELMTSLMKACQVNLIEAEVTKIENNLVHTSESHYESKKVIVATNAWASRLLEQVDVTPTRAQALKTNRIVDLEPQNFYFSDQKAYVRVCKDGSLVVGGMRTLDPKTEETSSLGVNDKIQNELFQLAKNRFSKSLRIKTQWSGIMGFSESQLPMAGQLGEVYYQVGFSGHGMGMCFLMARRLVQLALNQIPLPNWTQDSSNN